jgi:hypothetical protein
MYWRSVQSFWPAEKAFRSDARAVPKIVGEFLKPCGNRVQVNCPFSPVLELSHWKTNMGWLCGARWMQKNVSLRSRHVKNFASAGISPKSMYGPFPPLPLCLLIMPPDTIQAAGNLSHH